MRSAVQLSLSVALLVPACGDNGNPTGSGDGGTTDGVVVDAPKSQPCWTDMYTPSGTIQLGTGEIFQPMPDELRVVYGSQAGFHMPVSARVTGMVPGNPSDFLDPNNPRTRFRGFFFDTGEPVNPSLCGIRFAYQPAGGDAYDLARESAVLFQVGLPEDQIFGRQIRLVVEIIDAMGHYAMDEKVITCRAPEGWPGQ